VRTFPQRRHGRAPCPTHVNFRFPSGLRPLILTLLLAVIATSTHASVEANFQTAREAYQKGKFERFYKIADNFPENHLLTPYIRFWRMKADSASSAEQQAFIQQYADSPLSNRLRADLARQYGRDANWPALRAAYQAIVKPDQELQCYELRARQSEGDTLVDAAGIALWRTARDLPSSCDPLFTQLAERGLLTLEVRLARLRLALDDGNLRLARELDARLPADSPNTARMAADALSEAQRNPKKMIAAADPQRAQREVALYALTQIAKTSPEDAAHLWEQHQEKYTTAEQRYGWGQIGLHAARRHDVRALTWFQRAGAGLSEAQATWKARAALRAGKWIEVYRSIEAMPESMQNEAVWRYWKARSLKAMNAVFPANVLFAKLSREIHYYGLLADEELPTRLETRPADYKVTPDDLKAAEAHTGLQRALLLRKLGDDGNALAEWDWALRGMEDRALLAAAELARRNSWNDRAIATAEKTREVHAFDLRYISPYRDLASQYAQQNGLDEAWVYGLMRQESRFMDYARSGVGAQGLMQIMPATARWISRQLGLGKHAHNNIGKPETNIRFGTFYLKNIFDSLGQSPVLATAAYNAGPGRARKWQADVPLEGAIYVENIPFSETRDYVKKVLANAMFYRSNFGGVSQTLKERLGVIPARSNAQPALPDEVETAVDLGAE
jgi:soluble lytic murein transglycosylase